MTKLQSDLNYSWECLLKMHILSKEVEPVVKMIKKQGLTNKEAIDLINRLFKELGLLAKSRQLSSFTN